MSIWKYREWTKEQLIEEIEKLNSKIHSLIGEKGAYKAKVTKEIKERERKIKDKEISIEEKINFLNNNNYDELRKQKDEIIKEHSELYKKQNEYMRKCNEDFENGKQEIINKLSEELIRWTEEYDIDNERSQGYLIGINKAKKIIKENLINTQEEKVKKVLNEIYKIGGNEYVK